MTRALAGALSPLLDDPAERLHLGEVGRKVVAEGYSLDVMLNALDRVYQRILPT